MMTLRWGEDEDALAAGMSSGDGGIDAEHAASEKRFKKQGKAETRASKAQAASAQESRTQANLEQGANFAMALGQTVLALGEAGVLTKAEKKAEAEAEAAGAFGGRSAGLDVKRQTALDAGNTARAARLGARSIGAAGRSARRGLKADYGSSGKPLFRKGMSATEQRTLGIDQPAPYSTPYAAPAGTNMAASQEAWLQKTGAYGHTKPVVGGDYWHSGMGTTIAEAEEYRQKMATAAARWKENPMKIPGSKDE